MARLVGNTLTVEGGEEVEVVSRVQWGITATHQEEVATLRIDDEGGLHVSRKKKKELAE